MYENNLMEAVMDKSAFEIKAIVAGASQKEMLDFESAFKQIAGCSMESPLIDDEYLKTQGLSTCVGVKALLVAKLPMDSIDKIAAVFESFCQ